MSSVIKVVSITEIGQLCASDVLGTAGTPGISYTRRAATMPFAPLPPVSLNRPEFLKTLAPNMPRPDADMLCAVRNAFLFGPYGFVVLPDGTLIKESMLHVDAVRLGQNFDQFKALFPGDHVMWSHAAQPVLALNGYSTNNYFHFLIDNLTQLQWREDSPHLAALPVILSGFPPRAEAHQPFIPALRGLLGLDGARAAPFDGTMMFCSQIIFPARHMGATPGKVETLRTLFAAHRSTAKPHRLLYLDRPVGERRQLVNAQAVRALAVRHGFEIINPGALAVIDQVRLFSEARMICGPHGAAFANAAFTPPGGAVLELTHTGLLRQTQGPLVGPLFYELAAAAGLAYGSVVGDPTSTASEPLEMDFTVDLAQMETALMAMSAVLKN
jgi:Glycosyltransferase 61